MVENITDNDFDAQVLRSDVPVLVDFWAEWCGPCKTLAPVVEELANEYQGKVKFCKINIDENSGTTSKFGIKGIPTLILFRSGEVVDQLVGAVPKGNLKDLVDRAL